MRIADGNFKSQIGNRKSQMSDHTPSRNLSEIGHLFLSSVRDRQTGGAALPKRQPPGSRVAPQSQPQHPQESQPLSVPAAPRIEAGAIELTAEEIEGVRVGPAAMAATAPAPVSASASGSPGPE